MENNLEIEIKESIRKNLPEQVGAVLAEQLAKLEILEKERLSGIADVEQRNKTIASLREQVNTLEGAVKKAGDLDKRERELREREISATVKELQIRLAAEERVSSSYFQFMTGLVKNTEFKESVYKNFSTGTDYHSNGTTTRYPLSETVRTTKEVD